MKKKNSFRDIRAVCLCKENTIENLPSSFCYLTHGFRDWSLGLDLFLSFPLNFTADVNLERGQYINKTNLSQI